MSGATAIGLVGESLRSLLLGEMRVTPIPRVTILAPDEPGPDRRINLFLYRIAESPVLKNLEWQPVPGNPNRVVPPPLSLSLYYLMTAYAANDPETGNVGAHQILGEAMRVFFENPVLTGPYLSEGLHETREKIHIILQPLNLEELGRVWSSFQTPYRISVLYEISIIQVDALPEHERTLPRRVERIGVPEVTTEVPKWP